MDGKDAAENNRTHVRRALNFNRRTSFLKDRKGMESGNKDEGMNIRTESYVLPVSRKLVSILGKEIKEPV